MSGEISVRRCTTLEEFNRCVEMQREIWGEKELEVEPATMFVVSANTGGQVLGAFDGEKMVGYTLAVVGVKGDGKVYLHSHMTAVEEAYQNRGVGRMLKLFQRDDALARGIRLIEWTFDPLETRNAYFNLNRLGAICRRYLPNHYGITTSPLHRGLATDRLVAEWHLDSARVIAAIGGFGKEPQAEPAVIGLPAELEAWKKEGSERLGGVQVKVREAFLKWFAKGYAAVSLRTSVAGAAYVLVPWSDF
jgi:predicted GNAT superfamily acetyltransferase